LAEATRTIRRIVNEVLASLAVEFAAMYSGFGRPIDGAREPIAGSLRRNNLHSYPEM